jgi:hypothetical protein
MGKRIRRESRRRLVGIAGPALRLALWATGLAAALLVLACSGCGILEWLFRSPGSQAVGDASKNAGQAESTQPPGEGGTQDGAGK